MTVAIFNPFTQHFQSQFTTWKLFLNMEAQCLYFTKTVALQLLIIELFRFWNYFFKTVENIVHDISFNLKFKLHTCKYGFIKSKCTIINLITYLMKFYLLFVHRECKSLFIFILARPSIKERILLLDKIDNLELSPL